MSDLLQPFNRKKNTTLVDMVSAINLQNKLILIKVSMCKGLAEDFEYLLFIRVIGKIGGIHFTHPLFILRTENAGFSSWRQLQVTTCGYHLSFAWRPPFYSLAVLAYKNMGIRLGQRVLNLGGFDNTFTQTVFHFPNHTTRPRPHQRGSFCSKQGHIFLAEIKWYVMTMFPLQHQFLSYCSWRLSEQFNRNFIMWGLFPF